MNRRRGNGSDVADPGNSRPRQPRRNPLLVDRLTREADRIPGVRSHGSEDDWMRTLRLAFQSIGVVYGDIGTSPLYVYASTFTDGIGDTEDVLGVLSLILYTLIILPMLKYVFIVLWANDDGDGGTFALYSLISRYINVSLIPNQQADDERARQLNLQGPQEPNAEAARAADPEAARGSNMNTQVAGQPASQLRRGLNLNLESRETRIRRAQQIKNKMESSHVAQIVIFLLTILGTSMVMGDGVLTPCISVISAVSGLTEKATSLTEEKIVYISAAILVALFLVQRFGTDKVGYTFAPIILLWFLFIGGIGLYNLIKHEVGVLRAFNPKYIVDYFKRNGKQGWISLGGIFLCITGTEAMFADLGHFNIKAIQISFSFVLFPSVSLAYIGQAAFLRKHPDKVLDTFYKSIPGPLFWPTFVIAVLAAIIASQAMISGAFAIISQSQTLGCFPRVKVRHTSVKYEGQVYIPEINFVLAVACVAVTFAYRTEGKIGNAYGIAVCFVMTITTCLLVLIMLVIWQISIYWVLLFVVVFGGIELVYLSSVLYKFTQGGYLPLAFAFVLMIIMAIWHYAHVKKYRYELDNVVSTDYLRELARREDLRRVPGVGLLYTELVQGVPVIFRHLVQKIPLVHSVLVFVSIKHLPIPRVQTRHRFIFERVDAGRLIMFRCVARYGYKDDLEAPEQFEQNLVTYLTAFIRDDDPENYGNALPRQSAEGESSVTITEHATHAGPPRGSGQSTVHVEEELQQHDAASEQPSSSSYCPPGGRINADEELVQIIRKEKEKGVVYLLGDAELTASRHSSVLNKLIIDCLYNFMRKNLRQGEKFLSVPHDQQLKVGMTYEI